MPCRQPKPIAGASEATLKRRAYGRVRSQIIAGLLIVPETCELCDQNPGYGKDGRRLLQAHHYRGYDHPLDVQWLCVQCHRDETPLNPLRGEASAVSKLSDDAVRAIRRSGEQGIVLAAQYGVNRKTIYLAKTRKTWAHIQ